MTINVLAMPVNTVFSVNGAKNWGANKKYSKASWFFKRNF